VVQKKNDKKDKGGLLPDLPLPTYDNFEDSVAQQSRKGKKYKKISNYVDPTSTMDPRFKVKSTTGQKEEVKKQPYRTKGRKAFKTKGRYKRRK